MRINRISNLPGVSDVGDEYATYEVMDPETQSGVYYLAINKDTKLVNVYPMDSEGKINRVDSTILKYRTDLPASLSKDGALVFDGGKDLSKFLVDIMGEHAAIMIKDLGLTTDEVTNTAIRLSMDASSSTDDVAQELSKYAEDPYAGLEPEVVDVLKGLEGSEGGVGPEDIPGAPPEDLPSEGEEELPPEGEEEESPNAARK